MKITKRIHAPRLVYMRTTADMLPWLRHYADDDPVMKESVHCFCGNCHGITVANRGVVERYRDFMCEHCGALIKNVIIIPDVSWRGRLGNYPYAVTFCFQ